MVKIYGRDESEPETHYSPAKSNGTKKAVQSGNPDPKHISTSYAELARISRCGCRCAGSRA